MQTWRMFKEKTLMFLPQLLDFHQQIIDVNF